MKGKKVISILLSLVMTAVLLPLAAIPALAAENTEFTIIGWEEMGPLGSVKSVKINGEVLPQTGGTIKADPLEEVNVEITLNDGYSFATRNNNCLAFVGVKHRKWPLSVSSSFTKIILPSQDDLEGEFSEPELNLQIPTCITSVDLTVGQVVCGDVVEIIDGEMQNPLPVVTVPAGAPYQCYANWLNPPEGTPGSIHDFGWLNKSTVWKGGDTAYIGMIVVPPTADAPGIFSAEPGVTINLKGADLLLSEIDEYGNLYLAAKTSVVHVPGATKTENVVAPGCEKAGSHDEAVYCEKCGAKISSKTIVDPALGHDWGAWQVVKQPTATEKGLKQRVCKNDASHVQTMEIPATGKKKNSNPSNDDPSNNDPSNNIPKTGDENPLGLWIALLALSLLALSGYGFQRIRSAGKKNE